jgi:protein phosphatase
MTSEKYEIIEAYCESPGRRYGHSLVFRKPYILVYGGNIESEKNQSKHCSHVWALNLEKSYKKWDRIEIVGEIPPLRMHHAAMVRGSSAKMAVFGGKAENGVLLNDMWELIEEEDG